MQGGARALDEQRTMTRRFYKAVTIGDGGDSSGFGIHLDGKEIRTPGGAALMAPTKALAQAIALEWQAQETEILPETMPLTQLLNTCIDRGRRETRQEIGESLAEWINTDLLCYRAAPPSPLAALQAAAWDPWLEAFFRRFGVRLLTTQDLAALSQPDAAAQAVRDAVQGMSDAEFTALQVTTAASGSVVLALALVFADISARDVFAAAHIEEEYHERLSGEDRHGRARDAQRRRDMTWRDLESVERFLRLIRSP